MAITSAQWRSAVAPLLANPDEWAYRKRLTYRIPVSWVLSGVLGEGSSARDQLYVWSLWMPLFVPSDNLTLSHGRRMRGLSHFADVPAAVANALRDVPDERQGLRRLAETDSEAGYYALLLLGKDRKAAKALKQPYATGDDRPFVVERRNRMAHIASLLERGGVDLVTKQLREWRAATLTSLRLDRWVDAAPASPLRAVSRR